MERGSFSAEELQRQIDALIEESDVIAHQALSNILNLIRSGDDQMFV